MTDPIVQGPGINMDDAYGKLSSTTSAVEADFNKLMSAGTAGTGDTTSLTDMTVNTTKLQFDQAKQQFIQSAADTPGSVIKSTTQHMNR